MKTDEKGKLFSVIIVCRNEEATISKTLESVQNQIFESYECIVVDGASTDSTCDIVSRFMERNPRIHCVSEIDSGVFNAMNKAVRLTQGQYIYFLNSGDCFVDAFVLQKISKVISEESPDILMGNYIEKRHEISNRISLHTGYNWLEALQSLNSICHQAIFARRECVEIGFDENFRIAADYDWLCKQCNLKRRFLWTDVDIVKFDTYGISSLAKNWKKTINECTYIAKKNFPQLEEQIVLAADGKYQRIRNQKMYDYMNDLLALKQRERKLQEYFEKHSYESVAIYGFHHFGQRLYKELLDSNVEVIYIIENNSFLWSNGNIHFKRVTDNLTDVDVVVVTPIFDFYEIREQLEQKVRARIISLEDVINEMYDIVDVEV